MFTLILLAQLILGASPNAYLSQPEFKEWFKKAKVGDSYKYSESCGCNTCGGHVTKVSDSHVSDSGITSQTLLACPRDLQLIEVPK
jgi:hypothetical protein